MDHDANWYGSNLSLGPGHIMLDGDSAPPKRDTAPNFRCMSAVAKWLDGSRGHFVWGIGLGPGDVVLDGDPSPPQKGHSRPHFLAHVYCGQTAGWIRMPATWHRGRTRPRPQYVRLGPSCLPKRGTAALSFRPMSIVAKRHDGSRRYLVRKYALAQARLC